MGAPSGGRTSGCWAPLKVLPWRLQPEWPSLALRRGLSAVAATPIVGTVGGTGLGSGAGISESVNGQVPWVSRWRWERRFGGGPGGAWQAVGKC